MPEVLPLRRILCPTGFSDFSYQVIEKGVELAKHFEAELVVLHVAPTLDNTTGLMPLEHFAGIDISQLEASVWNHAERELVDLIKRHHLTGVEVRTLLRRGYPAEEERFDLIVIATHGATGWRGHIFGSVAEKVLRIARCPVLVSRVPRPKGK